MELKRASWEKELVKRYVDNDDNDYDDDDDDDDDDDNNDDDNNGEAETILIRVLSG